MKTEEKRLQHLFSGLQQELTITLEVNRQHIKHPGTKGDECELNWIGMLRDYLPARYQVEKAFVVDSNGGISEQLDVVIFDRQYSPPLFNRGATIFVPAESVYAVFEVKQSFNKKSIEYASKKVASVRRLHPTSVPIPYAGGRYKKKRALPILGGLLALDCSWKRGLSAPVEGLLRGLPTLGRLDLGCSLKYGSFELAPADPVEGEEVINPPVGDSHEAFYPDISELTYVTSKEQETSLVFFFLRLVHRLQQLGTVPAIDLHTYGRDL